MSVEQWQVATVAELCAMPAGRLCCARVEAAVMLRLCGQWSDRLAAAVTSDAQVARRLAGLIGAAYGIAAGVGGGAGRWVVTSVDPGVLLTRCGLIDRGGRPVTGLPPRIAAVVADCDAVAMWRAAITTSGALTGDAGQAVRLRIDCPNLLVAAALSRAARRLGIEARSKTVGCDREEIEVRGEQAVALLHAAGAPRAATWWQELEHQTPSAGGHNTSGGGIITANNHRSAVAAARTIAAVTTALTRHAGALPPDLVEVGQIRLAHPTAAISELAALCDPPMTKDTYAGRLRRLAAAADHDQPPGHRPRRTNNP